MGDRDAVAVRRGDGVWQLGTAAGGQLAHAGQQVVRAVFAFVLEDGLQGIQPFLGFDGIEILHDGLHMFGPTGVGLMSASVPAIGSSTVMAGDILRWLWLNSLPYTPGQCRSRRGNGHQSNGAPYRLSRLVGELPRLKDHVFTTDGGGFGVHQIEL
ncbi:hypothetical protein FQZ97_869090 [compost metagenome]